MVVRRGIALVLTAMKPAYVGFGGWRAAFFGQLQLEQKDSAAAVDKYGDPEELKDSGSDSDLWFMFLDRSNMDYFSTFQK